MGIDAVALLRIGGLAAPLSAMGFELLVQHRGDASLLHTMARFDAAAPDEHALALRKLLGAELDRHQDERGILFFPDVAEPRGESYEAIVREIEAAGRWAPVVALDHVPLRFVNAPEGSHDALVAAIIGVLGRDAALELDMMAQVHVLLERSGSAAADVAESYQSGLERVAKDLGPEFAARYESSLRAKPL